MALKPRTDIQKLEYQWTFKVLWSTKKNQQNAGALLTKNRSDNKHGSSSFMEKKTSKQKTSKNSNNNKKPCRYKNNITHCFQWRHVSEIQDGATTPLTCSELMSLME